MTDKDVENINKIFHKLNGSKRKEKIEIFNETINILELDIKEMVTVISELDPRYKIDENNDIKFLDFYVKPEGDFKDENADIYVMIHMWVKHEDNQILPSYFYNIYLISDIIKRKKFQNLYFD